MVSWDTNPDTPTVPDSTSLDTVLAASVVAMVVVVIFESLPVMCMKHEEFIWTYGSICQK